METMKDTLTSDTGTIPTDTEFSDKEDDFLWTTVNG